MRIGILTGGGDCPGLNGVIRGVVTKGIKDYGYEFVGFRDGWKGPLENGVERIKQNLADQGIDVLIAIGGEDTLGVATKLDALGVKVIGVPKTIDNDLNNTDFTFGFDTSVNIAMEAIDRLHTTAESHHRPLIVEVMGRHAGWIALHSGIAGDAACILIPEVKFSVEKVCEYVKSRFETGTAPIIVIAEGAIPQDGDMITKDQPLDAFGHVQLSGIGDWLAAEIETKTGYQTRCTVLGHIQRGGTPSAFDRVLSSRFGLEAITAVHEGDFGKMMALHGTKIARVPLASATDVLKTVPIERYEEITSFFG
jgi:6-phosphofructokinase 1